MSISPSQAANFVRRDRKQLKSIEPLVKHSLYRPDDPSIVPRPAVLSALSSITLRPQCLFDLVLRIQVALKRPNRLPSSAAPRLLLHMHLYLVESQYRSPNPRLKSMTKQMTFLEIGWMM
jgi:hypothetical protein